MVLQYIKTHYFYYSGVVIGMLLDKKPWLKYEFLTYVLISIIVAHVTEIILKSNGTSFQASILICSVVGLIGHSTLRYATDVALPKVLKAITDKIVNKIKNK
jgi:phage-related holin